MNIVNIQFSPLRIVAFRAQFGMW